MAVGARLVKSISNIPMAWIQDFSPNKPRTVIFTSGDDNEDKQLVIELIESVGLSPSTSDPSQQVAQCMRWALHYLASNSTSSGGFVEYTRTPPVLNASQH